MSVNYSPFSFPRSVQLASGDTQNKAWLEEAKASFGYKMMLKMGWKGDSGLGKEENGATSHIRIKKRVENVGRWPEVGSAFSPLVRGCALSLGQFVNPLWFCRCGVGVGCWAAGIGAEADLTGNTSLIAAVSDFNSVLKSLGEVHAPVAASLSGDDFEKRQHRRKATLADSRVTCVYGVWTCTFAAPQPRIALCIPTPLPSHTHRHTHGIHTAYTQHTHTHKCTYIHHPFISPRAPPYCRFRKRAVAKDISRYSAVDKAAIFMVAGPAPADLGSAAPASPWGSVPAVGATAQGSEGNTKGAAQKEVEVDVDEGEKAKRKGAVDAKLARNARKAAKKAAAAEWAAAAAEEPEDAEAVASVESVRKRKDKKGKAPKEDGLSKKAKKD